MLKRNSTSSLRRCAMALAPLLAGMAILPGVGCLSAEPPPSESLNTADQTFEAFEATVYREPNTGVYIVNGDTPVATQRKLQDFYIRYVQAGALIVNQASGADTVWDAVQKVNLTYCVSKTFGANYDATVKAMEAASGAWAAVTNIKYVHLTAQDDTCTAANVSVIFDVSPTTGQAYLARSFFPDTARADRNVMIDATSFGNTGVYTLAGILRHELGHTLGFRHEHTRKESGTCFEDANWRELTTYDSDSVMHYPQCNGTNKGDLVLTAKDIAGAALLYGAPGQAPTGGGAGNPGSKPGACVHDVCTAGAKLDPTCDTAAVCKSDAYCCSSEWDATCVKEASAVCNKGALAKPATSCAHDICAAGAVLDPACNACAKQVIVADPYCGKSTWDVTCVKEAMSVCGAACAL